MYCVYLHNTNGAHTSIVHTFTTNEIFRRFHLHLAGEDSFHYTHRRTIVGNSGTSWALRATYGSPLPVLEGVCVSKAGSGSRPSTFSTSRIDETLKKSIQM